MTDKELSRRIEQINKSRADYYEFYTGQKWGDKSNYDLLVNTSFIKPDKLAEAVKLVISN